MGDVDRPRIADRGCVAFAAFQCIAAGPLWQVAREVKAAMDRDGCLSVLILDAVTSEPLEVDLRGTPEDVVAQLCEDSGDIRGVVRAENSAELAGLDAGGTRSVGRPRLGVVAREVTLLPRHWEWLADQPGGASVTLRKLVEEARRSTAGESQLRRAREACYRFMNTIAGNEPGFEEALRALYAGDKSRFTAMTETWPPDVRDHARRLAEHSFG